MQKVKNVSLKDDLKYLGIVFILLLISLKIAFYNETHTIIFRTTIAIFWLFILPGFSVMLYWKKLEFLTRLLISIPLSASVLGTASYYLGLIGFNLNYHTIILPAVMIAVGLIINLKQKKT